MTLLEDLHQEGWAKVLWHEGIRQVGNELLIYEDGGVYQRVLSVHVQPLSFLSSHISPPIVFEKVNR